jgi:Na+/glutamate symporter|tara:strand:- start:238 stop:465 length:228 start_codon:yes stop_codon:yes gene_type:complete
MKKISSYLLIGSVLATVIAGVINYYFVKEHNNKVVNDSLAKARAAKKEKAEQKKKAENIKKDTFNKEIEIINNKL